MTEQQERDLIARWWDDHARSIRPDLAEFYAGTEYALTDQTGAGANDTLQPDRIGWRGTPIRAPRAPSLVAVYRRDTFFDG